MCTECHHYPLDVVSIQILYYIYTCVCETKLTIGNFNCYDIAYVSCTVKWGSVCSKLKSLNNWPITTITFIGRVFVCMDLNSWTVTKNSIKFKKIYWAEHLIFLMIQVCILTGLSVMLLLKCEWIRLCCVYGPRVCYAVCMRQLSKQ